MSVAVDRLLRFRFPVYGKAISTDQGEAIYASICRRAPSLHGLDGLSISPVCGGLYTGELLTLDRNSVLYVQAPQAHTAVLVGLAGHGMSIKGVPIRLGPPSLSLIQPTQSLQARFVTVKNATEPETLLGHLRTHLNAVGGHAASVEITRRRIMSIHGKRVVGFGVRMERLEDMVSLTLQIEGFGGRRRFGGGVFLPVGKGDSRV